MPGIPTNIDMTSWPAWLVALLLIVNLFKAQIGAIMPKSLSGLFKLTSDRQEHAQEIERALIDHRLQTGATEQLRASWREEKYIEMFHEFVARDVQEIKAGIGRAGDEVAGLREDVRAGFGELKEALQRNQTATEQTNNTLRDLYILFAKRPPNG